MRPAELDDSAALLSRPAMRRQILDTTARLLREHSYQSTTVRAIADRVGIKGGSLYHHFSSKDAIIVDVVNQGVAIVREAVQAAIDGLPAGVTPRGKAEAMLRAHLRSSLEHSDYVSASLRTFPHLPPPLRDACREERRRYEALWADLVAEAQFTGRLAPGVAGDAVRLLLLGAVNWAGEWYRPGRLAIDRIARDWAELVFKEPAPT